MATTPAPRSLPAAQKLLDAYRHDYNHHRPHEAIGQAFPADVYTPDPGIEIGLLRDHNRLSIYYGAAVIDTLNVAATTEPSTEGRRGKLS